MIRTRQAINGKVLNFPDQQHLLLVVFLQQYNNGVFQKMSGHPDYTAHLCCNNAYFLKNRNLTSKSDLSVSSAVQGGSLK
ncbi:MAG: hypothetical protein J6J83_01470 [Oscillospiraceae bacterium]|nr:hypothetical protein [Oscillospiraceae bacterium]